MELNTIYNESCLDTLARMPDASIDCCVTSPPYYGLRSYGTSPQVWGNHNGCSHVWESGVKRAITGGTAKAISYQANQMIPDSEYPFCSSCNAWRGELGLEPTFQLYISHLIDIFREVKRALKPSGTVWVNLGDSYSASGQKTNNNGSSGTLGHKHAPTIQSKVRGMTIPAMKNDLPTKSLMNIPARFAIAMTDDLQMVLRNEIIWHKPACMPSSAKDRFTVDFEKIFFFTKATKYWFEQQLEPTAPITPVRLAQDLESQGGSIYPGKSNGTMKAVGDPYNRNMRTTWKVNFEPSGEEHYASYPTRLIEIPIKAGCPPDGVVYDPFFGTGTTGVVARKLGRKFIGSELNPKYHEIATKRLEPLLAQAGLFT